MSGKVYDAEWRVCNILDTPDIPFQMHGTTVTIPVERKFGSVETVQAYVDHVCKEEGRSAPKVVVSHRMTRRAVYFLGEITLPNFDKARWAWREAVVLHETAHHLSSESGHGKEFREIFARLLDKYIGPEVGWVYQTLAMEAQNV
jgi:putative metallohydrolase (TIGR04338 family)